ncbi:hypothetical protein GXW83_14170 [Streptacidiphilus sp. PB12-B1b]|uniref:DUF6479 family protein n=1 Tax=Streptacidiphilus sp. PB12-B1b TaxID=2705012 RepID=UPI0015FCE924|nr:DUF6479 family protein [Streptacidiphilus sp. PB12-B1b]QMU76714.1 hypothetical protein GXW83_14170 [Streptacidiphilus sp. PB12-B1b]
MTTSMTYVQTAAGSIGSAGAIALVAGIVVVAALITAFVWGARRKEKEPPPLTPSAERPPQEARRPDSGSWSTPASTPGESPRGGPTRPDDDRT